MLPPLVKYLGHEGRGGTPEPHPKLLQTSKLGYMRVLRGQSTQIQIRLDTLDT